MAALFQKRSLPASIRVTDTNILTQRKERAKKMARILVRLYPKVGSAYTSLNYSNPWELTVAVILSARTTDKKVNEVTKKLFKKYKTINDYAKTPSKIFAQDIKELGFFNVKAKNITAAAKIVTSSYNGKIPTSIEEITLLPGVARKTANVVLWNAYGVISGVPVDTHVRRFALKFGLTDFADPIKIEKDLMNILPKRQWPGFTHRLILYGRETCPGRKHDCSNHPLTQVYPKAATIWPKSL